MKKLLILAGRASARGLVTLTVGCLLVASLAVRGATKVEKESETAAAEITNKKIAALIKSYEEALNASDTKAVMDVYGSEPIFMPQNSAALVGRAAVKASYDQIFASIRLKVAFTIREIVVFGDLAYVRTTSAGQQEVLATHQISEEANNEVFIFRQEEGGWKIYRYLFATSNPPVAR